ncbi:MAG TPA: nickel insertion protein, partial [Acidobacteriaceae bacterium]
MSAEIRVGWLECFAGISGDMLLGALIDAGVPAELLQNTAAGLGIGASLKIHSVVRSGIRATKVDVLEQGHVAEGADHAHAHEKHDHPEKHRHEHVHGRHWPEIRALIDGAAIPAEAKAIAQRAFALLAEAEAKIHGIAPEQVHFHEVGAVDA